jgi:hypothetical protein
MLVVACGRSNLDGYDLLADAAVDANADAGDGGSDARTDTGPEAGTCNAATCANGCCDGNGQCQTGTLVQSCGGKGLACVDCVTEGFDFCDPSRRSCAREVKVCNAMSCADGCCASMGGRSLCLQGDSPKACGKGGAVCASCSDLGGPGICDPSTRVCKNERCGPGNCPGCCSGNDCRVGDDQTACGANGGACEDCTSTMDTCVANGVVGGQCQTQPALCNPTSCPTGCCLGDVCQPGTALNSCGTGANQCDNCGAKASTCTGQTCVPIPPTCTLANCAQGCCDAQQVCHGGFLNGRCGSAATTCVDCTATASTCDLAVSPRVCTNMQNTCPAPYPGCPGGVATPVPSIQHVCPTTDLADARAACAGGAHSAACNLFYSFERSTNPSCAACLAPFDYGFQEAKGIFSCVAPFVSASCNNTTGCAIDCQDKSCAQCAVGATQGCENSVRQGQCSSNFQASSCIGSAFGGPTGGAGAFCNPFNYGGNFGRWLQGVGGHYCQ